MDKDGKSMEFSILKYTPVVTYKVDRHFLPINSCILFPLTFIYLGNFYDCHLVYSLALCCSDRLHFNVEIILLIILTDMQTTRQTQSVNFIQYNS